MTTVYERFYDMTPEGQARAELDVANEAGNRLMDAYNALRAELATTRAELDAAQCRADAANRFASAAADRVLAEMERAADAWRRVAELEAAQQWRNTLVGFLARDDAWRICLTAMLWTESGQAKTPRIAASLRDVFGHTLNAEIPEDTAIESALREMERWFSAPSRLEEPTP